MDPLVSVWLLSPMGTSLPATFQHLNISIVNLHPNRAVDGKALLPILSTLLEEAHCRGREVGVIFVDNPYMQRLNRQYREVDCSTDVLSFGHIGMEGTLSFSWEGLGDIYVSLDKAAEQAKEYGVSFAEEIKRLVIHGCLHLLGYDHAQEDERIVMARLEARYLAQE